MLFALLLAAAQTAPPIDAQRVLAFLNRTIAWNDRIEGQAQLADQPTDVLYVNDNRQLGRQVVALSFEAAKAQAQLLSSTAPAASQTPLSERQQRLAKRAVSAADQLRREQARLAELKAQHAPAPAIAVAQSRVAIAQARNDAVSSIAGLISGSAAGSDLSSQISALEQAATAAHTAPVSAARHEPPSSVIGLISDILQLGRKASTLQAAIREADVLQRESRDFSAPLSAQLAQIRKRADAVMSEPDSGDAAELDALAASMRQLSGAMLPLAKRRVLLEAYKSNLGRWRASVIDQRSGELRRLTYRAVALGVLLLLVIAIAVIWRRVTFRYVQDVKRRHHFLLIRRIVLLVLVAGIITATFAADFSSLTTFVGLLTAGIAIALQDVILSIAGYFVIIGKYGIRPGDRVRIAAVSGDVLDVGLVWIYLIELEARGSDQLPTGRIVEFPNSVVFDHSAGIFKQLPGTRFLWHEVSLTVSSDSDFHALQARMLTAVESVFREYADDIDRQHRDMDRLLDTTTPPPRPHSRLRVAPNGIEIRVRYPVEIANAGETDDRVAAAVAAARVDAPSS